MKSNNRVELTIFSQKNSKKMYGNCRERERKRKMWNEIFDLRLAWVTSFTMLYIVQPTSLNHIFWNCFFYFLFLFCFALTFHLFIYVSPIVFCVQNKCKKLNKTKDQQLFWHNSFFLLQLIKKALSYNLHSWKKEKKSIKNFFIMWDLCPGWELHFLEHKWHIFGDLLSYKSSLN